jgi:hypothetical protein
LRTTLAVGGLPAVVGLEVFFDFLLDGGLEHFAGALGDELFQGTFGIKFCWPLPTRGP